MHRLCERPALLPPRPHRLLVVDATRRPERRAAGAGAAAGASAGAACAAATAGAAPTGRPAAAAASAARAARALLAAWVPASAARLPARAARLPSSAARLRRRGAGPAGGRGAAKLAAPRHAKDGDGPPRGLVGLPQLPQHQLSDADDLQHQDLRPAEARGRRRRAKRRQHGRPHPAPAAAGGGRRRAGRGAAAGCPRAAARRRRRQPRTVDGALQRLPLGHVHPRRRLPVPPRPGSGAASLGCQGLAGTRRSADRRRRDGTRRD
mmetsp:Transcript_13018/g.41289  ORF Transcript_13018/g.41289 Transcript_13018/m.41289 type:complete len:265 (+) Transcript_13018:339-1133(+)